METKLTFEESVITSNYMKSMKDKVDTIAKQYLIQRKIDDNNVEGIKAAMTQCLWTGFCNGRYPEEK